MAIEQLETGQVITLRGKDQTEVATLNVQRSASSVLIEFTAPSGTHLSIEWELAIGRMTVKDLNTGAAAESFATHERQPKWEQAQPLLRQYRAEIEMAANALQDAGIGRYRLGSRLTKRIRTQNASKEPRFFAKDESVSCSGDNVRGQNYAATASACCDGATLDANQQCTNTWCIGCCAMLTCDKYCALGDYLCFCGITGTKCTLADYPPGPPPGGGGGSGGGGGGSCIEGDLVTPADCVDVCGGVVDGDYCDVP